MSKRNKIIGSESVVVKHEQYVKVVKAFNALEEKYIALEKQNDDCKSQLESLIDVNQKNEMLSLEVDRLKKALKNLLPLAVEYERAVSNSGTTAHQEDARSRLVMANQALNAPIAEKMIEEIIANAKKQGALEMWQRLNAEVGGNENSGVTITKTDIENYSDFLEKKE